MPEKVSTSINGQSRVVPPGFRFHPTEEELLQYYLRKKVRSEKIDQVVIEEVDLHELEPWDIQAKCEGSTPQNDIGWYFFSRNDKKYPSCTRSNRATTTGVWKATGREKVIYSTGKLRTRIGMRKTLVYYGGRAPLLHKSDWIMYEYRHIDDNSCVNETFQSTEVGEMEEGWVVCRIFKKKQLLRGQNISPAIRQEFCTVSSRNSKCTANNLQKTEMYPYPCSRSYGNDDDQGQIFQHMWKIQPNSNNNDEDDDDDNDHNGKISPKAPTLCSDDFVKLPSLPNPGGTTNKDANSDANYHLNFSSDAAEMVEMETDGLCDWLSVDQLLAASHLNSDNEQQYSANSILNGRSH